jgi:hypothetical protein
MGPNNSQQGTKFFPIWTAYLEFLELNFEVEAFLEFWYWVLCGINYFADLRMTFRQNFFFTEIGLETNLE